MNDKKNPNMEIEKKTAMVLIAPSRNAARVIIRSRFTGRSLPYPYKMGLDFGSCFRVLLKSHTLSFLPDPYVIRFTIES